MGGGGVLPYMDYIGMCRCEGYGFQAVYSRIEYINHSLSVSNRVSFFTKLTSRVKILSRLRKPEIPNRQSLSLRNSASTVSNGYPDIITY